MFRLEIFLRIKYTVYNFHKLELLASSFKGILSFLKFPFLIIRISYYEFNKNKNK